MLLRMEDNKFKELVYIFKTFKFGFSTTTPEKICSSIKNEDKTDKSNSQSICMFEMLS